MRPTLTNGSLLGNSDVKNKRYPASRAELEVRSRVGHVSPDRGLSRAGRNNRGAVALACAPPRDLSRRGRRLLSLDHDERPTDAPTDREQQHPLELCARAP